MQSTLPAQVWQMSRQRELMHESQVAILVTSWHSLVSIPHSEAHCVAMHPEVPFSQAAYTYSPSRCESTHDSTQSQLEPHLLVHWTMA